MTKAINIYLGFMIQMIIISEVFWLYGPANIHTQPVSIWWYYNNLSTNCGQNGKRIWKTKWGRKYGWQLLKLSLEI